MSSELPKKIKRKKIMTYDPTIKLSHFKKFQMLFKIKKEKFLIFIKGNKTYNFYKEMFKDIFLYSLCGTLIMLPFSSSPIIFGISIGTGIWLYFTRIHKELKEILASLTLIKNVRYDK